METGGAEHERAPLSDGFGPFDGRVWLDCAHQGPLPLPATEAAAQAIEEKVSPHRLADREFSELPARLREALGRLVHAPADEIVLGNSTSYGLNLIAQGFPWERDDEVILIDGDFPATVFPWLPLRERGVRVRLLKPRDPATVVDDLIAAIGPATRLICVSWVFSFTGYAIDLERLGRACRERAVRLVVNGSQGVGAASLDLAAAPVDALASCGFKWLCGPYATGFAWIRPDLRERLDPVQCYWQAHQRQDGLARGPQYEPRSGLGARAFDVFATANFLGFAPWLAAVEHLLGFGRDTIAEHDQHLVQAILSGLERLPYRVLSPGRGRERSTLVLLSHDDADRNRGIHRDLAAAGVDVAFRGGALRLSPHLYNGTADIDRALRALAAAG